MPRHSARLLAAQVTILHDSRHGTIGILGGVYAFTELNA